MCESYLYEVVVRSAYILPSLDPICGIPRGMLLLYYTYICIFSTLCTFFIKAHALFALKAPINIKAFLLLIIQVCQKSSQRWVPILGNFLSKLKISSCFIKALKWVYKMQDTITSSKNWTNNIFVSYVTSKTRVQRSLCNSCSTFPNIDLINSKSSFTNLISFFIKAIDKTLKLTNFLSRRFIKSDQSPILKLELKLI